MRPSRRWSCLLLAIALPACTGEIGDPESDEGGERAAAASGSPIDGLVTRLYLGALGRAPDPGGLANWVAWARAQSCPLRGGGRAWLL